MNVSFIVDVSTKPFYLFTFFLFILVLFHGILVFWLKLDNHSWKKTDYIWLSIAGLGLLAASAQAETFLSKIYLKNWAVPSTEHEYKVLRSNINEMINQGHFLCRGFRKSPNSPDDFDIRVEEYRKLCEQVKSLNKKLPLTVSSPFPSLTDLGYTPLEADRDYVAGEMKQFEAYVERYQKARSTWEALHESGERSSLEDFFTVLGPLMLTISLALRITKVSGELLNESRPTPKM